MSTTGTRQGTGLGVHVIYPHLRSHDIDRVRKYLEAIGEVWHACVDVAGGSSRDHVPLARSDPDEMRIPTQPSLRLLVDRLTIGSPMDITFAVGGAAGTTTLAFFVVRLFAQALRDPTKIGSWLPLVLAGWHEGMSEAERQRAKRQRRIRPRKRALNVKPEAKLAQAADQLVTLALLAQQVTVIGTALPESDLKGTDELPGRHAEGTDDSE